MSSKNKTNKQDNYTSQCIYFLQKYLFPLVGIVDNNVKVCNPQVALPAELHTIYQDTDNRIFFSSSKEYVLYLDYTRKLSEDRRSLLMNVLQIFGKVCPWTADDSEQHVYYSDVQRDAIYSLAVEKGICNWILSSKNDAIEKLLNKLEKWSVQTYEGRNVTFGFLINPDVTGQSEINLLQLLDDDMSAAFTDCIHSVIELDGECNYYCYHSLSENEILEECPLDGYSPLRFNNVIHKYVQGNIVGIFLLNSGDIIIAKDGSVQLVKRNAKWLNLSFDMFSDTIKHYTQRGPLRHLPDDLLKSIFVSMLDVSFSHLGGIIAVVGEKWPGSVSNKDGRFPLLDPCDDLTGSEPDDIYRENKKLTQKDFQKRLQKRRFLQSLTQGNMFKNIDRKLRCELISLDGACILNHNGYVNAFGAIISSESGSTAGGRGAAAKTLSTFGLAAKISTDGYVELYINREIRYTIK